MPIPFRVKIPNLLLSLSPPSGFISHLPAICFTHIEQLLSQSNPNVCLWPSASSRSQLMAVTNWSHRTTLSFWFPWAAVLLDWYSIFHQSTSSSSDWSDYPACYTALCYWFPIRFESTHGYWTGHSLNDNQLWYRLLKYQIVTLKTSSDIVL